MSATATELPLVSVADVPPAGDASTHETVIEPRKGWIAVDWFELLHQRELLYFLVWRDIKVRYKQAVLGVAWAVLQPLVQVLIFSVIFGAGLNLASKLGSGMAHKYPVFVFAALLPWQLFAKSLSEGGMSLVSQQHLLTKIYFPRLFVPTASVGSALFDMLISLPIFVGMMILYGVTPHWTVIFLPFLVALTVILAAGFAYLLAALTVTYRDFRFIIPFMVQLWMWVSFIMIPVPDSWLAPGHRAHWLFYLNPMYGIAAAYRKVLIGDFHYGWDPLYLVSATAISLCVFVVGVFYFRRTERRFADIA